MNASLGRLFARNRGHRRFCVRGEVAVNTSPARFNHHAPGNLENKLEIQEIKQICTKAMTLIATREIRASMNPIQAKIKLKI
jgi:hypothetical protein